MPPTTSDFAAWAALAVALIGITPRLIAIVTRRKGVQAQGEITRFESILKAQDGMLEDCRTNCERLEIEVLGLSEKLRVSNRRVWDLEDILWRHGWRDPPGESPRGIPPGDRP